MRRAVTLGLLLAGCGADAPGLSADGLVPDFALVDENAGSDRFEEAVSPRDYLEKVSGWYFTHAT